MKLTLFGAALAALAPVASFAAPIIARQSTGPVGFASMSTENFDICQHLEIISLTLHQTAVPPEVPVAPR